MNDRAWDRELIIAGLREDVWRYLTAASTDSDQLVLSAASLLQMRASEVRQFARLHFVLDAAVRQLLGEVPLLMRRLATTTDVELDTSIERLRGPIRWGATYAARAAAGGAPAYVTAPSRRVYETGENRVLVAALHAIREAGRGTGWSASRIEGPAAVVRERVATAERWLQARPLSGIENTVPPPTTVHRVRIGRHRRRYASALAVLDLHQRYVTRLDRAALRRAIEHGALLVARDPALFELQVAFGVIAGLRRLGWSGAPDGILRPPLIFRGGRDGSIIDVFFQHTPHELAVGSRYAVVQRAHRLRVGAMLPDLVLRRSDAGGVSWLLIEAKMGFTRGLAGSARAVASDLLAYRYAFGPVLDRQERPYGLGVAWGEQLRAGEDGELLLCSPDFLDDALRVALA